MTGEMEYRATGDGRRVDVLMSEVTGLSRSRVASLMASGCCLIAGKPCLKAGTKTEPGQEILLIVPRRRLRNRKQRTCPWRSSIRTGIWRWSSSPVAW